MSQITADQFLRVLARAGEWLEGHGTTEHGDSVKIAVVLKPDWETNRRGQYSEPPSFKTVLDRIIEEETEEPKP